LPFGTNASERIILAANALELQRGDKVVFAASSFAYSFLLETFWNAVSKIDVLLQLCPQPECAKRPNPMESMADPLQNGRI
jgi:hypothetical protein